MTALAVYFLFGVLLLGLAMAVPWLTEAAYDWCECRHVPDVARLHEDARWLYSNLAVATGGLALAIWGRVMGWRARRSMRGQAGGRTAGPCLRYAVCGEMLGLMVLSVGLLGLPVWLDHSPAVWTPTMTAMPVGLALLFFAVGTVLPCWVVPEMRRVLPLSAAFRVWALLSTALAATWALTWRLEWSRTSWFVVTPVIGGLILHFSVVQRVDRSWQALVRWLGFSAATATGKDEETAVGRRLRRGVLALAITMAVAMFAGLWFW